MGSMERTVTVLCNTDKILFEGVLLFSVTTVLKSFVLKKRLTMNRTFFFFSFWSCLPLIGCSEITFSVCMWRLKLFYVDCVFLYA